MAKLLSTLPVGSKIRFGRHSINGSNAEDIVWLVAANNHVGYPADTVTLISKSSIDQRAIDAKELSNTDESRMEGGSNRYAQSNIHQWLNKSGTNWYAKSSEHDMSPTNDLVTDGTGYSTVEGFMSKFTLDELKIIKPTNIAVTIVKDSETTSRTLKTIPAKFFLPSKAEIGFIGEPIVQEESHTDELTGEVTVTSTQIPNSGDEGVQLPLFNTTQYLKANLSYQAFVSGSSYTKPVDDASDFIWALRTPNSLNTSGVYAVEDGHITSRNANVGHLGIRPICNIASDIYVIESEDGTYDILYSDVVDNSVDMKPTGVGFNWNIKLAGTHMGVKSQIEILDEDGRIVKVSDVVLGEGAKSINIVPNGEGIYRARVKLWSNSLDVTYSEEIRYIIGKVKYELKLPKLKTLEAGTRIVKIPVKCTQSNVNMTVHAVNRHNVIFKASGLTMTDTASIKVTGSNTELDKLAYNIK